MDPVLAQFLSDTIIGALNVVQVALLAWIGSEQAASSRERRRRQEREDNGA